MKKVKTLLVSAIAALSLSACTLQDIVDWGKNAGGQVGQFFDNVLAKLGLKEKSDDKKGEKEEPACNHEDKNHDGTCDLCGETGLTVIHSDENHDHFCDGCGAELSKHVDENNDFVCDYCGAELRVTEVRLDTSDAQLFFALGEEFSAEGVKVIATSELGNEKELEFQVSEPDMSTVGDKEVVVIFGEGNEDNLSYTVNVSYWSEEDLAVLNYATILGYYGKIALPYLAGFNMRVEAEYDAEDELESFKVVADDITAAGYLDLYNAMLDLEAEVTIGKYKVTFELSEVAGNFEGFHDLTDVSVLRLVPYFVDSDGYNERYFVQDEYYILGINADGQLIIETRNVNAMLDGMFFGDDFADGTYYFPAQYNAYLNYLPAILGYYYSELSEEAFIVPQIGSSVTVMPMSYASLYPLEESLDVYDLAWVVELDYASQAEAEQYVEDLLDAGYTEYIDQLSGEKSYYIDDELYGYIEIAPTFYPEDGQYPSALVFTFFYIAPDSYTNHLTLGAVALEEMLGVELDIDNDWYEDYGVVIAEGGYPAEGLADGEEAVEAIARKLRESGLEVYEEIDYDSSYEQFTVSMASDEVEFYFYVDEEATGDEFGIEVYISDLTAPFELTNAEVAAQDAFEKYADKVALKGVDYEENVDGSFSFEIFLGSGATADDLQGAAEFMALLLGDSFVLADSAADEGGETWTATFNNYEDNVQVKATASLEGEGDVYVTLTFANVKFVTPETTMVNFLTALNGSAPTENDYLVDQEGACLAEFELDGTHEASELQELAEGLIAKFGEGFEKASSEAGQQEGTWVVLLENEDTGVQAEIEASIDADGKVTVNVLTDWIPEPQQMRADEVAMVSLLTTMWGEAPEFGTDYKYNEANDMYTCGLFIFNSNYGDASYNQGIANAIASCAPDSFSVYQEGETTYSGIDAYQIILVDFSTMVIIQITVFVHPSAGVNVFQILTYIAG